MGLTYAEARELLAAVRHAGAAAGSVATVGRQSLYLHPREARRLVDEFALDARAPWLSQPFGAHADGFFRDGLGADVLDVLDASDYEGATLVHDLNDPLPQTLAARYDLVVDGGSLEHVFRVTTALESLMRMVRPGGRLLLSAPANNLCGHGFYQFSPELMFRVFDAASGFALHRVALVEAAYPSIELQGLRRVHDVTDPDVAGERVTLMSRRAAMLLVHAEKLRHLDAPLARAPVQSDYAARWAARRAHAAAPPASGRRLLARLPLRVRVRLRGVRQRLASTLRNRRHYRRAP
jgi:SAM-dependent methyltransferase